MTRTYKVADLFAGAGGFTSGAVRAIRAMGADVDLVAVNHWATAVATHSANHVHARHYCLDLESANPTELVPDGRLDLLMASPSCTHHSRARGGKPVNDQQRASPWLVNRWLTELDVDAVLVENVGEIVTWGPVDPATGKPIASKKGTYFQAWTKSLRALGYAIEWKILNAADFGDATTRQRFFLIGKKGRRSIRWPEPTHSRTGAVDLFGGLPKWRAAREVINWSNLGPSLLGRKKPLSLKTRLRIARGLQKYGGVLAPFYIRLLDLPASEAAAFDGPAEPFVFANRNNAVAKGIDYPIPTVTTATGGGAYLVTPAAFVLNRHGENGSVRAHDPNEPLPTVTGRGAGYLVSPTAEPFVVSRNGHNDPNGRVRPASDPLATITGSGSGTGYLVSPSAEPFVLGQQGGAVARSADEPLPTIATDGAIRVATPIAEPFLAHYYGTGTANGVDEPLATVTTKPRFGLASPLVVPYGPRAEARAIDDALPTIMTKDRLGLATPIAGAFIVPKFGERGDQVPRVHDLDDPLPTVTGVDVGRLVTPLAEPLALPADVDPRRLVVIDGVLHLLDIRFRMLTNRELARAMGFSDDESEYEFRGTQSEVTKQIGNAVPVGTATALVRAILGERAPVRLLDRRAS